MKSFLLVHIPIPLEQIGSQLFRFHSYLNFVHSQLKRAHFCLSPLILLFRFRRIFYLRISSLMFYSLSFRPLSLSPQIYSYIPIFHIPYPMSPLVFSSPVNRIFLLVIFLLHHGLHLFISCFIDFHLLPPLQYFFR